VCRTGDLVTTRRGYFYLSTGSKRMINAAGFKVWPAELESLLYGPSRRAGSLAFIPHRHAAHVAKPPKRLFVLAAGQATTEQEVITWCQANMSALQGPQTGGFCRTHCPNLPPARFSGAAWAGSRNGLIAECLLRRRRCNLAFAGTNLLQGPTVQSRFPL